MYFSLLQGCKEWKHLCRSYVEGNSCVAVIREIKIHVYSKRQTSDSSWEFLRIKSKQIKTIQNNSYG